MVGRAVGRIGPSSRRTRCSGTDPALAAASQAGEADHSFAAGINKATTGTKKPFTMSYDGVTEADYIAYMIARGTR